VSLALRAAVAIGLMVLFYAAALAASAGLVWLGLHVLAAVPEIRNVRAMVMLGLVGCASVAAAGVVLWSVAPRPDRFTPPGPEIREADQPRLFAELRAVAAATGQRMPAHVYVVAEVNAFVAQRGGIVGLGSRRVMGLGLPLLRAVQVDELRAVIAHEMGHFYGGDTRLGPFIYKTRGGLVRTVVNLARVRHSIDHWIGLVFAAVQAPFRWLLIGFLRVSQAISRAQELSADAVAVRAEGARALVDGLKKTHAAAIAHEAFMRSEVLPLVERGALPAVGEGFTRFLGHARAAEQLAAAVESELTAGTADPYDAHPPLRERIAHAVSLAGPERPPDPRRAIELLDDPARLEASELAARVARKLDPVSWEATAPLWIASFRDSVRTARAELAKIPVEAVPCAPPAIYQIAARVLGDQRATSIDDDDLPRWWTSLVGSALALRLIAAGFDLVAEIGEPFRFTRGELTVEPFIEFAALLAGTTAPEAWTARWTALGLAGSCLA
jgi:heat shock protein HtpX